jgi:hypothetical protein
MDQNQTYKISDDAFENKGQTLNEQTIDSFLHST